MSPYRHNTCVLPAWGLSLLMASATANAQSNFGDCVNVTGDADRLACYDRAHGRAAPAASHALASPATPAAAHNPAPSPATPRSTLATRWDLKGPEGAMFAPRAYRPVYILPATWTDQVNSRPTSPSPRNSVTSDLQLVVPETKYQIRLKA